jgi:hypothetical protein
MSEDGFVLISILTYQTKAAYLEPISPGAFETGVIEIMNELLFGNAVSNIAASYKGNILLYLYGFVYEISSPEEIAVNVIGKIKIFNIFMLKRNLGECIKIIRKLSNWF